MSNVPFYRATEIFPRTWQIRYNYAKEEDSRVFCYLIEGQDYALVVDTMLGYGNLKTYCETLTDKPLKLVNTHFHLDHTGGNFYFDSCYIHHLDIPFMYNAIPLTQEQYYERGKKSSLPEYADQLELDDFVAECGMRTYPIYDGDVFDLGDRKIEVVDVGGHSAGSIVLIDHKLRAAFSGDACNGNTLLGFGNSVTVEQYLLNLLNLKKHQSEFDIMYGGHQVCQPSIIDEAIELAARIIAGLDDRDERMGRGGRVSYYGAKHSEKGFGRADGKSFNMSYSPERILGTQRQPQVITMKPVSMF